MKKQFTFFSVLFTVTAFTQTRKADDFSHIVPKGYVIFDKVYGDLNKDGRDDCVLIIKDTDKSKVVINSYNQLVDRNRRGIIVLFSDPKYTYTPVVRNYSCFSSENEEGGVYFPPDMSVEIQKGNLYIHYGYGRYGYWRYTFRFQKSDFELIGYDESNNYGPIIDSQISINFLTKKKLLKENTNESPDQESGEEIFNESWLPVKTDKLLKLSEIKDFDALEMP